MQIGGPVIGAIYPRITCLHGVKYSIALVFSDWAKIKIIKVSNTYITMYSYLYLSYYIDCLSTYNDIEYDNTYFICYSQLLIYLLQVLIFKI